MTNSVTNRAYSPYTYRKDIRDYPGWWNKSKYLGISLITRWKVKDTVQILQSFSDHHYVKLPLVSNGVVNGRLTLEHEKLWVQFVLYVTSAQASTKLHMNEVQLTPKPWSSKCNCRRQQETISHWQWQMIPPFNTTPGTLAGAPHPLGLPTTPQDQPIRIRLPRTDSAKQRWLKNIGGGSRQNQIDCSTFLLWWRTTPTAENWVKIITAIKNAYKKANNYQCNYIFACVAPANGNF